MGSSSCQFGRHYTRFQNSSGPFQSEFQSTSGDEGRVHETAGKVSHMLLMNETISHFNPVMCKYIKLELLGIFTM